MDREGEDNGLHQSTAVTRLHKGGLCQSRRCLSNRDAGRPRAAMLPACRAARPIRLPAAPGGAASLAWGISRCSMVLRLSSRAERYLAGSLQGGKGAGRRLSKGALGSSGAVQAQAGRRRGRAALPAPARTTRPQLVNYKLLITRPTGP